MAAVVDTALVDVPAADQGLDTAVVDIELVGVPAEDQGLDSAVLEDFLEDSILAAGAGDKLVDRGDLMVF